MKQMLKRKDGSVSQRGLWDNIRAKAGSGKAPTKEMLKQEKKIKMATVKKAQKGIKATADSSAYFRKQGNMAAREMGNVKSSRALSLASNKIAKATKNEARQKLKGKPGYDANGFPLKKSRNGSKMKMQAGGVAGKQPKAGMVDPNGAYTKVQKRTLGSMKKSGKAPKALFGIGGGGMMRGLRKGVKKGLSSGVENLLSGAGKSLGNMAPQALGAMAGVPGLGAAKKGAKMNKAEDGKWIQKAVNPKHKGYCTPMTKKTCTPKRKALAQTFKRMAAKRKGK